MILQTLNKFYDRANLAPPGWEYKEIPFVIVLNSIGKRHRPSTWPNGSSSTSRISARRFHAPRKYDE